MSKITIREIDVKGKRVLVRVDFNVPLNPKDNTIMDDSRIRATFPTIKYLVEHQAKTILCSHLGRPDGKIVEELKMAPIARRLSSLVAIPVQTADDCIGEEVRRKVNSLQNGQILMLENLRFHPEEENNDAEFARQLASLGDIFVNDAFGAAHRAHASTVGVTKYLPAYCGLLMEKEINALGNLLSNPESPFAALLGGAKVSDKIGVVTNILNKIDILLIGGAMGTNFLKALGFHVGLSKIEEDKQATIKKVIDLCGEKGVNLVRPVDVIISKDTKGVSSFSVIEVDKIPADSYVVDIGPKTTELFVKNLRKAKTIFWNGPMGIYEIPAFSQGTRTMAFSIAYTKGTTIIGGGSTAEIVEELNLTDHMTHVSTGGGASLEFLEGKTLPGIAALLERK